MDYFRDGVITPSFRITSQNQVNPSPSFYEESDEDELFADIISPKKLVSIATIYYDFNVICDLS